MTVASGHPGVNSVSGPGAPVSVLAGDGASGVSGVAAPVSVLAADGGSAISAVGAPLSVLAGGGGSGILRGGAPVSVLAAVGRVDRDPRRPGVVLELGARLGFAAPALLVPAVEALVLRRVVVPARDGAAGLSPLEPDAGVAAGGRRSILSAGGRGSGTAARAARWACLPASSLPRLSAFAACLRRPTCRRRSNRSGSFLAMSFLLALPEITRSQPYRRR